MVAALQIRCEGRRVRRFTVDSDDGVAAVSEQTSRWIPSCISGRRGWWSIVCFTTEVMWFNSQLFDLLRWVVHYRFHYYCLDLNLQLILIDNFFCSDDEFVTGLCLWQLRYFETMENNLFIFSFGRLVDLCGCKVDYGFR